MAAAFITKFKDQMVLTHFGQRLIVNIMAGNQFVLCSVIFSQVQKMSKFERKSEMTFELRKLVKFWKRLNFQNDMFENVILP